MFFCTSLALMPLRVTVPVHEADAANTFRPGAPWVPAWTNPPLGDTFVYISDCDMPERKAAADEAAYVSCIMIVLETNAHCFQ